MSLFHDVRIVLRTLGRRPGMVSAIILTLSLGIGANTAVYSLVDAVLLHPVPGVDSKEVVSVYSSSQETPFASSSFAFYQAIAQRAQAWRPSAHTPRPNSNCAKAIRQMI